MFHWLTPNGIANISSAIIYMGKNTIYGLLITQ